MKFDPIKKNLYTDTGELIKKLYCPYIMQWDNLINKDEDNTMRQCSNCESNIVDTAFYNDEQLLSLIKKDKKTCLKVNLNQHNIQIISNGTRGN